MRPQIGRPFSHESPCSRSRFGGMLTPRLAVPLGRDPMRFKNTNRMRKVVDTIVSIFLNGEMRMDLSIPADRKNTFFRRKKFCPFSGPEQFFRRSRPGPGGRRWSPALLAGPAGASLRILTPSRRIWIPGWSVLKDFEGFRSRPNPVEVHFPMHFLDFSLNP